MQPAIYKAFLLSYNGCEAGKTEGRGGCTNRIYPGHHLPGKPAQHPSVFGKNQLNHGAVGKDPGGLSAGRRII